MILTCAHIFKIDGRKPAAPAQFPRRIMIDLFDGKLKGTDPARVHFLESVEGKAVDYDFTLDVGLIRIQPGRRLPASRVVPASLGAPSTHEGPRGRLLGGKRRDRLAHRRQTAADSRTSCRETRTYEAIECDVAPKEGRSGGGLYTIDGYVAGVCNFAEPQGNHGLYATPRSIYQLLDRNSLTALYAPARRGSDLLLAGRRPGKATRRSEDAPVSVARSQSPDGEEPPASRNLAKNGGVMIPSPGLMGIPDPVASQTERSPQAASGTTRRTAWHLTPDPVSAAKDRNSQRNADRPEPRPCRRSRPLHQRAGEASKRKTRGQRRRRDTHIALSRAVEDSLATGQGGADSSGFVSPDSAAKAPRPLVPAPGQRA